MIDSCRKSVLAHADRLGVPVGTTEICLPPARLAHIILIELGPNLDSLRGGMNRMVDVSWCRAPELVGKKVDVGSREDIKIPRDIEYARIPALKVDGEKVFPEFWLTKDVALSGVSALECYKYLLSEVTNKPHGFVVEVLVVLNLSFV